MTVEPFSDDKDNDDASHLSSLCLYGKEYVIFLLEVGDSLSPYLALPPTPTLVLDVSFQRVCMAFGTCQEPQRVRHQFSLVYASERSMLRFNSTLKQFRGRVSLKGFIYIIYLAVWVNVCTHLM